MPTGYEIDAYRAIGAIARNTGRIADALQAPDPAPAIALLREISKDEAVPMHYRADADQVLLEVYRVKE